MSEQDRVMLALRYVSPFDPVPPGTEWRLVVGLPYEVSEYGHVRRAETRGTWPAGRAIRPALDNFGYIRYSLRNTERSRSYHAHRMVADAFLGKAPSPAHQVAHNDGNRMNCSRNNLRWATAAENTSDRAKHGTNQTGEKNRHAKLTADDVRAIRADVSTRPIVLARRFGITYEHLHSIKRGKCWRHL